MTKMRWWSFLIINVLTISCFKPFPITQVITQSDQNFALESQKLSNFKRDNLQQNHITTTFEEQKPIDENLVLSNSAILGTIEQHFDQVFNYAQHKLTTKMRRWSAYSKMTEMVRKILPSKYYDMLKISMENLSDDFIVNNSQLVPTGDYYYIEFKIGKSARKICFKVKHVGAPELDNLEKISQYFTNPLDFEVHHLTTEHHRLDAYNFIKQFISSNIIPGVKFTIDFAGFKDGNVVDNSDLSPHGDWFQGTVKIGQFSETIIFKLKNVGFPEYSVFDQIKTFFTNAFGYEQHRLQLKSPRKEALDVFKKLLGEFIGSDKVKAMLFEMQDPEGLIINNSSLVPYGDWFDIGIKWNGFATSIKFKVKNIGNPDLDLIDNIETLFQTTYDVDFHNFTSYTRYWEVELFVIKLVRDSMLYNDFLKINIEIIGDKNLFVKDTNPKAPYSNGDLLMFEFKIGTIARQLSFKVKNVGNILNVIEDYFGDEVDYGVHGLSIASTEQDVIKTFKAIVKNLIGQRYMASLTVSMLDFENKIISETSDQVMNGIGFDFLVEMFGESLEVFFKLKNVVNPLEQIAQYFEQVFDFDVHKLSLQSTRITAFLKAVELIYLLVGEKVYKQIEFHFHQAHGKVVDKSPLVPTGDWFEMDLAIGYYKKTVRFKVKNVGNYDNYILQKIAVLFEQTFDYSVHKLTTHSQVWEAYWTFRNIVSNLIGIRQINTINFEFFENINQLIVKTKQSSTQTYEFKIKMTKGKNEKEVVFKIKNLLKIAT